MPCNTMKYLQFLLLQVINYFFNNLCSIVNWYEPIDCLIDDRLQLIQLKIVQLTTERSLISFDHISYHLNDL